MSFFNFFGSNGNTDQIQEYLDKGAVVVDVRTKAEWDEGHVDGSVWIELGLIPLKLDEIDNFNKPVIVVCRSGGRAGQAIQHISRRGVDAINGGAWQNVATVVAK